MKLEWIGKNKAVSRADVSISKTKAKKGRTAMLFTFRNGCMRKITNNLHVEFSDTYNNNIYFKKSDEQHGFKITQKSNSTRYGSFKTTAFGDRNFLVGDYDLLYDRAEDLYYIDLSLKLK